MEITYASNVMLAVHSCRVRSVRFSSESYTRWDCASVAFYTLAASSQSTKSENKAHALWPMYRLIKILDFFRELRISLNVLTPADVSFQTPKNIWKCGLKKKLLKIKTSMCARVYLIFACDTRRQPCETQETLTWASWTTKKARASEARHECPRQHDSIRACFHLHSRSRIVEGSLSESVQPA